jgi:hypothetical protein
MRSVPSGRVAPETTARVGILGETMEGRGQQLRNRFVSGRGKEVEERLDLEVGKTLRGAVCVRNLGW